MPCLVSSVPYLTAAAAQERGPSLPRLIIENLPMDPASLVVYAILIGSIWLIWWANRRARRAPPRSGDPHREEPDTTPTPGPRSRRREGTRDRAA